MVNELPVFNISFCVLCLLPKRTLLLTVNPLFFWQTAQMPSPPHKRNKQGRSAMYPHRIQQRVQAAPPPDERALQALRRGPQRGAVWGQNHSKVRLYDLKQCQCQKYSFVSSILYIYFFILIIYHFNTSYLSLNQLYEYQKTSVIKYLLRQFQYLLYK